MQAAKTDCYKQDAIITRNSTCLQSAYCLLTMTQETINMIALTKIKGLTLLNARTLLDNIGSATDIMDMRDAIIEHVPNASQRFIDSMRNAANCIDAAKAEADFAEDNNIRVLTINDADYPQRLKECDDAPLVLYYCGSANLNPKHVVSMVGTRKCTEYGRELCDSFISDMKRCCPDTLIVSGLAYGIDICSHKASIHEGVPTVGVLAHGLDTIYPAAHRSVAAQMAKNGGGLLTEYTSKTIPEKGNFVRRNRIVAGMCDACVVVESSERGGSLITADLALNYNREVFAFPGRIYDERSAGCNNLIKSHSATLLTSANGFIEALGWEDARASKNKKKPQAYQQELFPDLTEEEKTLINSLKDVDAKHINQIVVETNIPYARASMLFFELEMKGIVKPLGGARYHLVRKGL